MVRMSTATADRRPRRMRRDKRSRRWIGWTILGIVLVVIAAALWVGVRGALAAKALHDALPVASRIQADVTGGNTGALTSDLAKLRSSADKAHADTSDPIWWLAAHIPGIGPNLRALGGVSASAATITDNGLERLTGVAGSLNPSAFKLTGGAIDLAPLAKAAPALAVADTAVQAGNREAQAVTTKGVIGPLASAVTQYKTKVTEVAQYTDAASRATRLLPGMLGADGPRTYLVLVLNNAELRASGGIGGSAIHVTANHGKITFDSQDSDAKFGDHSGAGYDQPVAKLAPATQQLFGEITGEYLQDITLTPRFDQTAQLANAMWVKEGGKPVSGVVSLDPIALKYILEATGPVTVAAGTPEQTQLSAANVVKTLLSDVYFRFVNPADQDRFFAASTGAIIQKLTSGQFKPSAMLGAFAQIGAAHRMNVWSAEPAEQKLLDQTTLAGGPARSTPGEQRFGVYLADGTGSKMDYYLTTAVKLGQLTCPTVGPLYVVEVTLKNRLAASAVATLPAYVSGAAAYGVPVGTARTEVTVYGSPGVEFGNAATATGQAQPVKFVQDGTQSAAQYFVDLKPGQASTIRLVFNPKKGVTGKPAVDVTPQVNHVSLSTGAFECGTVLK